MKSEPPYETMFEALLNIGKDLHEKLDSLDEQIRRSRLECLEDAFRQQKEALAECLDGIDHQMITLSVYIQEYRQLHSSLKTLSEKRIPEAGGTSPIMPDVIVGDTLETAVIGRLDYLKSQGKIRDL